MTNVADALQAGIDFHNAGNLRQAEQMYRQVLAANPRHAPALHLLGLLAFQAGNPQLAIQFVTQAIRIDGGQAAFHGTLAEAYRLAGQPASAIACYRQALRINPQYAAGHSNLGTLLQASGDDASAADCYREALRLQPAYAAAHRNLASVLQRGGNMAGAAEHFGHAVRLKPDDGEAQLGLGYTLRALGKLAEAAPGFEAAVRLMPNSHLAHCIQGLSLQAKDRPEEAIAHYRRAIEIVPHFAEAHYNLGTVLREQDQPLEAIEAFCRALQHKPSMIDAHINVASVFNALVRPDEAVAASRYALDLDPQSALATAHLASALQMQGEMDAAIAAYRRAVELDPTNAAWHSNLIYTLNFHPGYDAAMLLDEHRAWARRHADHLTVNAAPPANDRTPDRPLRIGYVSPHFREHAVAFFSEPMLAAHDHRLFQIFCYSHGKQDAATHRFQAAADHWRDVSALADDAVAQRVREDKIDILVDLAGHIGANRLPIFARRPAPVQATYLGYQNTTGMVAMDYRLTDAHADPPGMTEAFYTEQHVRLPRSFFCYQAPDASPQVNALPAGDGGPITFASLNHIHKITRPALELWARLLASVADSRLIVLAYTPGHFESIVRDVMTRCGVDPQRVEVVNKRPRYEYLELHHRIDIALDSFPFNGHTTACDALWMGVPSIMLEGGSYASRFGGSTLLNVGLGDLIARTTDQYVEIAVALAADRARLAELRATARARMQASVLMDAAGFTRNLETEYRRMWCAWCESGQSAGARHGISI